MDGGPFLLLLYAPELRQKLGNCLTKIGLIGKRRNRCNGSVRIYKIMLSKKNMEGSEAKGERRAEGGMVGGRASESKQKKRAKVNTQVYVFTSSHHSE